MAGYIVNGSKFTPFTFDEMLKPLQMYTDKQQQLEDNLSSLSQISNKLSSLSEGIDRNSNAYNTYSDFIEKLKEASDELLKTGYNARNRNTLNNFREMYVSKISPIQEALDYRKKLGEEQVSQSISNPNIMFDRNANEIPIDTFMKNAGYVPESVDLLKTQQMARESIAPIADQYLHHNESFRNIPGSREMERVLHYGIDMQDVQDAMEGKGPQIIRNLISSTINSTGVQNWNNPSAMERLTNAINLSITSALGRDVVDKAERYIPEYSSGRSSSEGSESPFLMVQGGHSISSKDATPVDRIVDAYFPRVVLPDGTEDRDASLDATMRAVTGGKKDKYDWKKIMSDSFSESNTKDSNGTSPDSHLPAYDGNPKFGMVTTDPETGLTGAVPSFLGYGDKKGYSGFKFDRATVDIMKRAGVDKNDSRDEVQRKLYAYKDMQRSLSNNFVLNVESDPSTGDISRTTQIIRSALISNPNSISANVYKVDGNTGKKLGSLAPKDVKELMSKRLSSIYINPYLDYRDSGGDSEVMLRFVDSDGNTYEMNPSMLDSTVFGKGSSVDRTTNGYYEGQNFTPGLKQIFEMLDNRAESGISDSQAEALRMYSGEYVKSLGNQYVKMLSKKYNKPN